MYTYMNKRKAPDRAAPPVQEAAPSRSEMLHLSGAGAPQPMSPQLREKFEPGFNADFSNIRISRGHIPEELGVEAVAQGTDILLDERAGMDVLGHELSHVVQQAQGRVEGGFPVVENAALEHEADVMGARVASGLTAQAGPQNGFGGETMSISPMSSASAPAQCKGGKRKPGKQEDAARAPQQASGPYISPDLAKKNAQRQQWHGMLSPAVQPYVDPLSMEAQPTISHAEMDAQLAQRRDYAQKIIARGEVVDRALQSFYNDPNAERSHSGAGDMGRRIEALFDVSGSPGADSYNRTMMEALDEVHRQKDAKSYAMSDGLSGKLSTAFAPTVQAFKNLGSDSAAHTQFAKGDYGESKQLSGQYHALSDIMRSYPEAARDKMIQDAGYAGSYEDFSQEAKAATDAFLKVWRDDAAGMGVPTNALYSSMMVELKDQRAAAARAAAAPQPAAAAPQPAAATPQPAAPAPATTTTQPAAPAPAPALSSGQLFRQQMAHIQSRAAAEYGGQTHGRALAATSGADWSKGSTQDWLNAPSTQPAAPQPKKKSKNFFARLFG